MKKVSRRALFALALAIVSPRGRWRSASNTR